MENQSGAQRVGDANFLESRATACRQAARQAGSTAEREDFLYLARVYRDQAKDSQRYPGSQTR
ncbi:hypothetical protein [Sphingomonas ginkgonis]|uniref:hypothetical protein n=1 Tax=Sphingomonas ginkgonis TaxID=2315330 RepID=UPI000F89777F|nr:hypothetical protein [Sphingomonas ginkgonis]